MMSKQIKIFVSQPMNGKTIAEIEQTRKLLVDIYREIYGIQGYDLVVLDNIFTEDQPPIQLLGRSLELMSEANIVIFDPHYKSYRGCHLEHSVCAVYDIMHVHITQDEWEQAIIEYAKENGNWAS